VSYTDVNIELPNATHLRTCKHCGITYDWRRSPSTSLKMTYCGSLCEQADLGFTVEAMLKMPVVKPATPETIDS